MEMWAVCILVIQGFAAFVLALVWVLQRTPVAR